MDGSVHSCCGGRAACACAEQACGTVPRTLSPPPRHCLWGGVRDVSCSCLVFAVFISLGALHGGKFSSRVSDCSIFPMATPKGTIPQGEKKTKKKTTEKQRPRSLSSSWLVMNKGDSGLKSGESSQAGTFLPKCLNLLLFLKIK